MTDESREIWPLQIILDRYGGVYSGAKWIAWRAYIEQIPGDQQSGDSKCFDFWRDYDGFPPCGKGSTIQEAIDDLKQNIDKLEPKKECVHGKQFYCEECIENWSDEQKEMMKGIKA